MNQAQEFYDKNSSKETYHDIALREQSDIIKIRSFNNFIKSMLIDEYARKIKDDSISVLDLCCGKGGDIYKYDFAKNVKKVYFIDISPKSIDVVRERLARVHNFESFLRDGCMTSDYISEFDIENSISLVSCQFALHYCFDSKERASKAISNISKALVKDGYFICTIPNSYEIVRRLNAVEPELEIKNEFYSITFDKEVVEKKFPSFGSKYYFKLNEAVDCPEFLIHPKVLKDLCKEYNLECECDNVDFFDYFNSHIHTDIQKYLQTIRRMNPFHEKFANRRKIGILTKSEMQVIGLYSIMVFKKA